MAPETRYARSGDVNIAYQVVGDGPIDLVFVMGWVSNLDYFWEEPGFARFLRRLASFSRLILFDKRGTGLSDRAVGLPTLEQRMDDVRAVMDAVGSERAAVLGISEGGPMCALFAATYPERTSALVMIGGYPRRLWAPDYPCGMPAEEWEQFLDIIEKNWGGPVGLSARAPSLLHDERFRDWWAAYLRMSASPGAAVRLTRMNSQIDVRHVLPTIRLATLIIHRTGDRSVPVEASRYMAERIPGARYVEPPGDDHLPFVGDQDAILNEIEEFLTGAPPAPEPDRVLLTLLCIEIVGTLDRDAALADRRWRELLDAYHDVARKELARHRGREVEAAGDRLMAAFDGPARAITCACAIAEAAHSLGLEVRAGLQTGECELVGERVQGLTVHVAARVMAYARPGDILVSGTVRDLVAGSGLRFQEMGVRAFLGLPGEWPLFRVDRGPRAPERAPETVAPAGLAPPSRLTPRLTQRERDVARLVSLGLTNRQIAEELVITEATAERHVANILNKLGFRSRAQVAAWVIEQGLARSRSE